MCMHGASYLWLVALNLGSILSRHSNLPDARYNSWLWGVEVDSHTHVHTHTCIYTHTHTYTHHSLHTQWHKWLEGQCAHSKPLPSPRTWMGGCISCVAEQSCSSVLESLPCPNGVLWMREGADWCIVNDTLEEGAHWCIVNDIIGGRS